MITERERNGLAWIHRWAACQLYSLKRRRKYGPRAAYTETELKYGRALVRLRDATGEILGEVQR